MLKEKPPLISILYVSGVSEDIRKVCCCINIRVAFKSDQSLQSILTRAKDKVPSMAACILALYITHLITVVKYT